MHKYSLAGKRLHFAYADGYAVYEVERVIGQKAYLQHIDECDGWHNPTLEELCPRDRTGLFIAPKSFVVKHLQSAERLAKIFS